MSWYKKIKIIENEQIKKFKSDESIEPEISQTVLTQEQPKTDLPDVAAPAPPPPQETIVDSGGQNLRDDLISKSIAFIEQIKPSFLINEGMEDSEQIEIRKKFYRAVSSEIRKNNSIIENFNMQNANQRVPLITWRDVSLPTPDTGAMSRFLLPFAKSEQKIGTEDPNYQAILYHVKEVLSSNNITDDAEGARILADYAASDEHQDVRLIVNDYFEKNGRQAFQELLISAGFPNLSREFAKIPDKELRYRQYGRKQSQVKDDEVFGKDYGLETRSEAERQILSIFRAVDLQPIPVEIKMPSTKLKKGTQNINTEFMCDFLLPCEVLRGWNENGTPIIESQVVFVGEYFGWYGSDYESKTSMKEELEPFHAVLTGNDVIFITKEDFEAGANALKLINQLEAKRIIFKGGKAKTLVDSWLNENKSNSENAQYQNIEQRVSKLTPELAIVRAAMLQLQFKFGEIAKFYQNYANPENPEYQILLRNLFQQYKVLKNQADQINKNIRQLQHRNRVQASDYNWEEITNKSKNADEIKNLMEQLSEINSEIRNVYFNNEQVSKLRQSHNESLLNDSDYQARYNDLQTLYKLLEENKDPMPQSQASLGAKVAFICNNALAGLDVTLTRSKKEQLKIFEPKLTNAFNKYNKLINSLKDDFYSEFNL